MKSSRNWARLDGLERVERPRLRSRISVVVCQPFPLGTRSWRDPAAQPQLLGNPFLPFPLTLQHPPRLHAPTHHPPAFITCVLFSSRALSPPGLRANDGGGFHPRNECLGVSPNFRQESKGGRNGLSCSDNNFDSCLLKRQGI